MKLMWAGIVGCAVIVVAAVFLTIVKNHPTLLHDLGWVVIAAGIAIFVVAYYGPEQTGTPKTFSVLFALCIAAVLSGLCLQFV